MSPLAPVLQGFFTDKLLRQRQASPHTVAVYRDTCRLLLEFTSGQARKQPCQLDIADLDAAMITAFLQHLEADAPTPSPHATPGSPRSAPCSATRPCTHPSTPPRSAGSWPSRPNAATGPSCAS